MRKYLWIIMFSVMAMAVFVMCGDHAGYHNTNPVITFESLTSDGTADTAPALLTLTFSRDIPDLEADDIELSGPGTGVTKGAFTKIGTGTYTLAVSGIMVSGNLNITVTKAGFTIRPSTRSVAVFGYYWDNGNSGDLPLGSAPPFAGQTDMNNIIGKAIGGLMAWHQTTDWREWSRQRNTIPSPGNVHVEMWPAGWEDYLANGATLYDTGLTMPNGSTAQLFNSHDPEHILTHYQWLNEAAIDGSAIQKFYSRIIKPIVDTGASPNQYTGHRDAAEATGRFFFIMYDMSGTFSSDPAEIIRNMQLEWVYNVERKGVVSSPNYAHADGKPVVSMWGLTAAVNNRYAPIDTWIELITWFRERGYYVLGGVPDDRFWETDGNRHHRSHELFSMLDGISPWYGGRFIDRDVLGRNWLDSGMEFCRTNLRSWADNKPIDFMPAIWPGFAWTNMDVLQATPNVWPRNAGQFAWHQVREYLKRDTNHDISSLYLIMFDEYGEATVWMKAASDYFDIPLNQYFLTLAADGTWLSNDYYMRLAKTLVESFKTRGPGAVDIGPLNNYDNGSSSIVPHSLGPVFWRNSFERRNGLIKQAAGIPSVPVRHLPVDIGVPHGEVVGIPHNVTINGVFTVNRPEVPLFAVSDSYNPPSGSLGIVYTGSAKSGDSVFRLVGQRTDGTGASYLYKIADTRIAVESGMRLSYWINAAGLGFNVMVDLLLDDDTYVSASASAHNTGHPQNGWQQRTLAIPASLDGRYITAVIIAYRDSGTASGGFTALIDDIIIDR